MNTPSDSNDFRDRLTQQLRTETIPLPDAPGAHTAVARAKTRTRRRNGVIAGLAVCGLVAGVTAQTLQSDPATKVDTAAAPVADVDNNGVQFDWTTTDRGLSDLYEPDQRAVGTGGLYALSTAPGTRTEDFPDSVPKALYRLDDTGAWVPTTLDGDDPFANGISGRGDTLYALSTGTAANRDGVPLGSVSTDGGESWSNVPLPAAEAPSTTVDWSIDYRMQVASSATTTLAYVQPTIGLPYETLFPELFAAGESARDGNEVTSYFVEQSDAGFVLSSQTYDREESSEDAPLTPVRTVTWADLGLSGAEDLEPPGTIYQADGNSWTALAEPVPGDYAVSLKSDGESFLIHTGSAQDDTGTMRTDWHTSVDGSAWQLVGSDTVLGNTQIAQFQGSLVRSDRAGLSVSHDAGATWSTLDLSMVDPDLALGPDVNAEAQILSGPLGVAVLVPTYGVDSTTYALAFSTDLVSWTSIDLAAIAAVTNDDSINHIDVMVGADALLVMMSVSHADDAPSTKYTLVGTPIR